MEVQKRCYPAHGLFWGYPAHVFLGLSSPIVKFVPKPKELNMQARLSYILGSWALSKSSSL